MIQTEEKSHSALISSVMVNIFTRSPQSVFAASDGVCCRRRPSACRASEFPRPLATRGPAGPLRPPRQQPHPGTLRPAAGPPTPLPEEDASVRPQQRRPPPPRPTPVQVFRDGLRPEYKIEETLCVSLREEHWGTTAPPPPSPHPSNPRPHLV